jgi:two-component system NarL family sensor kinase
VPDSDQTAAGAVARFMLGSLGAIAVVVVGGFFALRAVTIDEAEGDTRDQVQVLGGLVQAAGLTDGVLRGQPRALERLDAIVTGHVLGTSVVRVKLWRRDGRIVYSDEPALIGRRFALGDEELELFDSGGADAELSDLSEPENRFEREEDKLLEAHTVIRTPNGTPVLFEIYERFSSVSASGGRLLRTLAPPLLGGLAVLLLFQAPLAWRMARRLQRGHRQREALLTHAVEASERERGRIAADLHDGVVQDIAGVAFGLAPLADEAHAGGDTARETALRDATGRLQQGVRDLRTLLVELHPPRLETAGLAAVLDDLLSPLRTAGVSTTLEVAEGARRSDALVYRVAREAVRNAREHAAAQSIAVTVTHPAGDRTLLVVRDDGRGFDPATQDERRAEGHVGLSLLADLVGRAGGRLDVRSEPGRGTTVEAAVPA